MSLRPAPEGLSQLIDAHERFAKGQGGGVRAILRFYDLSTTNFQRRLLSDADFSGTRLFRSRFAMADLRRASLYCADLRSCDLRGANLTRADLRGASFRGADLYGAQLDEADLRNAVLAIADPEAGYTVVTSEAEGVEDGSLLDGETGVDWARAADFRDCSMKRVRLGGANLGGADFRGAILDGANLNGAKLEGARFEAAVLTRVDLSRCAIDPAYLTGSVRDPDEAAHSRLEDIQRRIALAEEWVISRGAKGRTAVLDDEDLRVLPKGLTGRSLAGASFRRICGVGMDFSGAVLVGAVFNESDLRDADFSRSDLRGASFQDCRLDHARFDLSDLRSIETAKGRCAVSFFGSKLVQTRFDGAKVDMGSDHTPPSPTFGDSMARSRQERLQGAKEECPDGYRTIHP